HCLFSKLPIDIEISKTEPGRSIWNDFFTLSQRRIQPKCVRVQGGVIAKTVIAGKQIEANQGAEIVIRIQDEAGMSGGRQSKIRQPEFDISVTRRELEPRIVILRKYR